MPAASDSLPQRKSLPHAPPAWVKSGSLYFLTLCCTPRGVNQLCKTKVATALFESVAHRQNEGVWFMRLLVLMPDHLHALVSFPIEGNVTSAVRSWKSYLARQIGIKWQRDFFEHRIRHEESWEEKAHYMRENPVRAKLAKVSEAWPYVWTPPP